MDRKKFKIDTKVVLSSGIISNYYYDFNLGYEDKNFLMDITRKIISLCPINIIGIESFGIWILSYVKGFLQEKGIELYPVLFFKKREHGFRKRFYGTLNTQLQTYLLDDVITTGTTIKKTIAFFNKEIPSLIFKGILCCKNRAPFNQIHKIPIIEI